MANYTSSRKTTKNDATKTKATVGIVVFALGIVGLIVACVMIGLNRGEGGSLFAALTTTSALLFLSSLIVALGGAAFTCAVLALRKN